MRSSTHLLPSPRPACLVRRTGAREVAVVLGAYLIYGASRWLGTGDVDRAVAHAHAVGALERRVGISVERGVQAALEHTPWLTLLDLAYVAAQVAVVPLTLVWTYRRRRDVYGRLRTTIIATWMLAVPVFVLLPVAPPRLAGLGIADTLAAPAGGLNSRLATSFYNPLAAMPSLHCGFALAVSIALARTARHRWARVLAAAWTPVVVLAVVATGNHFVLDVLAGLALTLVGAATGRLLGAPVARLRRGAARVAPPARAPHGCRRARRRPARRLAASSDSCS
jgi:membrane-associated phospholipid phosphatase